MCSFKIEKGKLLFYYYYYYIKLLLKLLYYYYKRLGPKVNCIYTLNG
jgi:hypothetical protein